MLEELANRIRFYYNNLSNNTKTYLRLAIVLAVIWSTYLIPENIRDHIAVSVLAMKAVLFVAAAYGTQFVFAKSEVKKESSKNTIIPGFLDELGNYGIKIHAIVVSVCALLANFVIFHATGVYPSASSAIAIAASLLIIIYLINVYLALLSVFSFRRAYFFGRSLPNRPRSQMGFIEAAGDIARPMSQKIFLLYISRVVGCLSVGILSAQYSYLIFTEGLIFDYRTAFRIEENRSLPIPGTLSTKPMSQNNSPLVFALYLASTKQDCRKGDGDSTRYVPIDASRSVMIPRISYKTPNEEGTLVFADGIKIVVCDKKT